MAAVKRPCLSVSLGAGGEGTLVRCPWGWGPRLLLGAVLASPLIPGYSWGHGAVGPLLSASQRLAGPFWDQAARPSPAPHSGTLAGTEPGPWSCSRLCGPWCWRKWGVRDQTIFWVHDRREFTSRAIMGNLRSPNLLFLKLTCTIGALTPHSHMDAISSSI